MGGVGTLGGAGLGSGCRNSEDLTTPLFLVDSRTGTLGKTNWNLAARQQASAMLRIQFVAGVSP